MSTSPSPGQAIKVGVVGDIDEDAALVVPRATAGTLDDIAVIFSAGRYYAIDNTCTHEQTSLAQGWIENGCVECPLHAATFRLADGAALTQPATRGVGVHTVEVVGDELMLTPNPERLA
ncbi:Rieske 2Fe-2S domain-containing protein [Microbacterium aurantiacum]|uniref:Rieske 2Fe-2S domain-containing protein n=1 Tax=Microbacterium aurantiacum TaxID=162393 RepID=UPI003F492DDE